LKVRGVWEPQVDTIFDVHVVDTDATSYSDRSSKAVIQIAEFRRNKSVPLLVRPIVL